MTAPGHAMGRFDEALGRRVSHRALAVLRVLVGAIVLVHLRPFLEAASHGRIYRDAFYEPYAHWYPELPRGAYSAVLVVGAVAAVLMCLGLLARLAVITAFAVVTYNVFLSTTHFHNNRAYLIIVLGVLALAPCGGDLSLHVHLRRRRNKAAAAPLAPAWPILLLRFEASVVYGASGLSKLVDPDWFAGTVTWGRVVNTRDRIERAPLPDWFVSVLTTRAVHTYAAKAIVLTELFIALGLWFRRSRLAAVWIAVWFHVLIELTARVEIFSYLAIAALVVWAVPTVRDRTVVLDETNPHHRMLRRAVGLLDWLARFRIEPARAGAPVTLVDRDGATSHGRAAVVRVLGRLPLTAVAALPFAGRPRAHLPRRRAAA